MLKKYFSENSGFLLMWLLLVFVLSAMIVLYPKPETFLMLNRWHTPFLDFLFKYLTHMGDGIFVIALAVIFFLVKKQGLSFMILSSYLLSGIFVQIIKRFIPEPRPSMYFQIHAIDYSKFIEGVTQHNSYSFPSGHTTSVFALAACIALFSRSKLSGILLALLAVLVGYSRIYLGQHFPEDVLAGMIIGTLSVWLCYLWFGKFFYKWEKRINLRSRTH